MKQPAHRPETCASYGGPFFYVLWLSNSHALAYKLDLSAWLHVIEFRWYDTSSAAGSNANLCFCGIMQSVTDW